jgi:hypothetical protein
VVLGRRLAFGQRPFHQHIDDAAVLRVHADRAAVLSGPQQRPEDAGIVQHEDTRVGHEELERRHALADERVHFLFHLIGEVRDDHVEAVIDDRVAVRLLHPRFPRVVQRLVLVLNREVHDGGGAAEGCGPRARLEIVG